MYFLIFFEFKEYITLVPSFFDSTKPKSFNLFKSSDALITDCQPGSV